MLFLLLPLLIVRAETIIVGEVVDALSGAPIPNVSIYYRGTRIGCTSNQEGMFMLRASLDRRRTLVVSAVGYRSQHFSVDPEQYLGVNIALEESSTVLEDVFVVPKSNPAIPFMEQVRLHRAANDITRDGDIVYSIHERKRLFISDIDRRHLQRQLWRSMRSGMIEGTDSTYLLPLYSSEQDWQKQGNRLSVLTSPKERYSLLTSTDYSLLLSEQETPYNFYSNTISIFGKSFLSPLSSSGSQYYNFYLADSIVSGSDKLYCVHFRSKNAFQPTFHGEMYIDSSDYSLRSIEVSVPREANMNYLSSLHLSQTYSADHILEREQFSLVLDFAVKSDSSHIFPSVLIMRDLSVSDSGKSVAESESRVELPVDSLVYAAMDSLRSMPLFRIATFAAKIINTGYVPTGTPIDIGDIAEVISFKQNEGLHLGLPLRTNEQLWKNVSLGAYLAYGFRDRAWKGGGRINISLPTERRHTLNGSYDDHYVWGEVSYTDQWLRENAIGFRSMGFTTVVFNSLYTNSSAVTTALRQREWRVWTEDDWTDNVETFFDVRYGRMSYGDAMTDYYRMPYYRYGSVVATCRVGWYEKKVDYYFKRIHVHSNYPVVYLSGELGSYETSAMEEYALYGKFSVSVSQYIHLGLWGRLSYAVQSGIVIGSVPYPLLKSFSGNQTYTYDPYRFTLMNQWQYAADRYVLLFADWDMNGVLLNRIPGIRYLRLHELLEFKLAYGGLSSRHEQVLALPNGMQSLRVPYMEVGVGVGNILRVGEVYVVGRLTHWSDKNTPFWGVRFRLHLGM